MVEWIPTSGMPNEDDLDEMIGKLEEEAFQIYNDYAYEMSFSVWYKKYTIKQKVKRYPYDNFVVGKKGRRSWTKKGANNTSI